MQVDHMMFDIQNVSIETFQTHCSTLIAYTMGHATIPTCTGGLVILIICLFPRASKPLQYQIRQVMMTCISSSAEIEALAFVFRAQIGDL